MDGIVVHRVVMHSDAYMMRKHLLSPITVRNLPPDVAELVRRKAAEEDLSLNKTVIRLLKERIELANGPSRGKEKPTLHHDLDHLAGTWTDDEADEFDARVQEQRGIDAGLWE